MQPQNGEFAAAGIVIREVPRGKPIKRRASIQWPIKQHGGEIFANGDNERHNRRGNKNATKIPQLKHKHNNDDRLRRSNPRRIAADVLKAGNRRLKQLKTSRSECWTTENNCNRRPEEQRQTIWYRSIGSQKIPRKHNVEREKSGSTSANHCPWVLPRLADTGRLESELALTPAEKVERWNNNDNDDDNNESAYPCNNGRLRSLTDEDHPMNGKAGILETNEHRDQQEHCGDYFGSSWRTNQPEATNTYTTFSGGLVADGVRLAAPPRVHLSSKRTPRPDLSGSDTLAGPCRSAEPDPNSTQHIRRSHDVKLDNKSTGKDGGRPQVIGRPLKGQLKDNNERFISTASATTTEDYPVPWSFDATKTNYLNRQSSVIDAHRLPPRTSSKARIPVASSSRSQNRRESAAAAKCSRQMKSLRTSTNPQLATNNGASPSHALPKSTLTFIKDSGDDQWAITSNNTLSSASPKKPNIAANKESRLSHSTPLSQIPIPQQRNPPSRLRRHNMSPSPSLSAQSSSSPTTQITHDDCDGGYEANKARRRKLKRSTIHKLQDQFVASQISDSTAGEHNNPSLVGKSLDGKRTRSLDLMSSYGAEMLPQPQQQRMNRAERVFQLRMRDMSAARACISSNRQQHETSDEGTKTEEGNPSGVVDSYGSAEHNNASNENNNNNNNCEAQPSVTRPTTSRGVSRSTPPNVPLPADPPTSHTRPPKKVQNDGSSRGHLSAKDSTSTTRHSFNSAATPNEWTEHCRTCSGDSTKTARHSHLGVFPDNSTSHPRPQVSDSTRERISQFYAAVQSTRNSSTNKSAHKSESSKDGMDVQHHRTQNKIQAKGQEASVTDIDSSCHTTPTPSLRYSSSGWSSQPLTPPHSATTVQPDSSDHDTSPHKLEARIAVLERQNRMLQAALLAALDAGVTFDTDVVRNGTLLPSPAAAIAGPNGKTPSKKTDRFSTASTTSSGVQRTEDPNQRLPHHSEKPREEAAESGAADDSHDSRRGRHLSVRRGPPSSSKNTQPHTHQTNG